VRRRITCSFVAAMSAPEKGIISAPKSAIGIPIISGTTEIGTTRGGCSASAKSAGRIAGAMMTRPSSRNRMPSVRRVAMPLLIGSRTGRARRSGARVACSARRASLRSAAAWPSGSPARSSRSEAAIGLRHVAANSSGPPSGDGPRSTPSCPTRRLHHDEQPREGDDDGVAAHILLASPLIALVDLFHDGVCVDRDHGGRHARAGREKGPETTTAPANSRRESLGAEIKRRLGCDLRGDARPMFLSLWRGSFGRQTGRRAAAWSRGRRLGHATSRGYATRRNQSAKNHTSWLPDWWRQ
jgi:hypothetical protein